MHPMFSSLSERLTKTLKNIRGQGRLSEDNIQATLRDIRLALLEADVALPVVKDFIQEVKTQALGQEVATSLNPSQAFLKIVNTELTKVMGEANEELNLKAQPPAIILLAGLQGSGKTTSAAKLAKLLQEKFKKTVMLTSADIYRPAAIKQLETLAQQIGAHFHPSSIDQKPVAIAQDAILAAKKQGIDVVIVDTAGRTSIDADMMAEIQAIQQAINPVETLFVIDSMTGQDAANTAKAFNDALPLTGVILTKADGDARGGAALSVRQVTGKPIKFIGVGEKTDALEPFHPDRIASRILGMGDMLSLIEEVEAKVDKTKAEKMAKKLKKGHGFNLEDFADQLQQMKNMGGLSGLMAKIPGAPKMPGALAGFDDKSVNKMVAMIQSMTPQERYFPALIKTTRKQRIANGSGTEVQDVNRLLKQFTQMQKMTKKFSSQGKLNKMMQRMGGQMPQGFMPPK